MSFIPGSRPTAPPSSASLMTGRVFTASVFALVLVGVLAAVFAADRPGGLVLAAGAFIVAALIYFLSAMVMYARGDYILRMFGCYWPIVLAKADELQAAQRQRAFSFAFIVFLSAFSIWVGAHIGVLAMQQAGEEALTGVLPAGPWAVTAVLLFVFFTLTLLPQAYLAWTLKPLDAEDAE